MSYYLQVNPNPTTAQYGWPRTRVSGAIGVHTAENNTDYEGADPGAEDVARFIGRRTDHGSYHSIADADSIVQLVHPRYAAWADTTNNAHAMSVSGAMQAARWRDLTPERAAAITKNMAYAAAALVQDAIAAGLLDAPVPARRITPAEAIAGSRAGFYGHGETNPTTRYDPGQNFDWTLFLNTYAAATGAGGGIAAQGIITQEEGFELSDAQYNEIIRKLDAVIGTSSRAAEVAQATEDRGDSAKIALLLQMVTNLDASFRFIKVKGGDESLYEVERGVARGIGLAEWQAKGGLEPRYVDQWILDGLTPKEA